MKNYLSRFVKEEEGAELIEYAIVIAIVAVLAGFIYVLVDAASNQIQKATDDLNNIGGGASSGGTGGSGGVGSGTTGGVGTGAGAAANP